MVETNQTLLARRGLRPSFPVMVKPLGSRCNLNCAYCHYLGKDRLLSDPSPGQISDRNLENVICQGITEQGDDTALFTWHGGEPTLLGLDFFRRVVELERKYAGETRIENDLQTNGLLLDDAWCEFLKQHDFLVGLSIDGPKHLHDPFRVTKEGGPSCEQVCRAARLLRKHDVTFNTLTVVNSLNAGHPADVYQFLTEELGAWRLQWLPCVEPKDFRTVAPGWWDTMPAVGTSAARPGNPDSVVTDWSVDPDAWGEFLCQTFDLWLKHGFGRVMVNWFESLVGQWMGQPPQICTLADRCGGWVVIEKDGGVYSCDHFVYPEYRIGNVNDGPLGDIVYSDKQRRFGMNKRESLPDYCKRCKHSFTCNGECPKNRFLKTSDGQPRLNYLCSGIKRFLTHAAPHLQQIVARLHGVTEINSLGVVSTPY